MAGIPGSGAFNSREDIVQALLKRRSTSPAGARLLAQMYPGQGSSSDAFVPPPPRAEALVSAAGPASRDPPGSATVRAQYGLPSNNLQENIQYFLNAGVPMSSIVRHPAYAAMKALGQGGSGAVSGGYTDPGYVDAGRGGDPYASPTGMPVARAPSDSYAYPTDPGDPADYSSASIANTVPGSMLNAETQPGNPANFGYAIDESGNITSQTDPGNPNTGYISSTNFGNPALGYLSDYSNTANLNFGQPDPAPSMTVEQAQQNATLDFDNANNPTNATLDFDNPGYSPTSTPSSTPTGTPASVSVGYGIGLGLGDAVGGGFGGATGDGTSGGFGADVGGPGIGGASTGISGGPGGTGEGGANTGEGGVSAGLSGAGEGGGAGGDGGK